LLSLTNKDKFSTDGHAVLPYAWDPPTEAQIGERPLWTIFVCNPDFPATDFPAAGVSPPADDDATCKIVINPATQTWQFGRDIGETWSGSSQDGGQLLTWPYSVLSSRPTSPADLIATLLEAIAAGAFIILAGDDGTEQITDSRQRTIFRLAPDGNRRINEDVATRIPDLALLPVHERVTAVREMYVWRPNPATAGTQLQHQMQGRGNYTWSLISPALSASIAASGVATGASAGDQVLIEQLGTADQAVTHITAPDRGSRELQLSIAGWPGSDISQAKWFEMANFTASPGHTLRAQVLNAGRSLTVHNDGPSATFQLSLHSGLDKDPLAVRPSVQIPSGKAWRFEADWTRTVPNSPLEVLEMDKIGGAVLRQFQI
jgi:hypothetical protein